MCAVKSKPVMLLNYNVSINGSRSRKTSVPWSLRTVRYETPPRIVVCRLVPRQLHHFRCLQPRFGILVASRRAREISPTQWRAITRDSVAGKLISMQVISPRRRQNGAACRGRDGGVFFAAYSRRAPRQRDSNTVWHCLNSVWEHVFNVFFQISKMWLLCFLNTCQKVVKSR